MTRVLVLVLVAAAGVVVFRLLRRRHDGGIATATLAILIGGTCVLDVMLGTYPGLFTSPVAEPPGLLAALFGSRRGLFFFTPVLWLGWLGLAADARDDRPGVILALGLAVTCVLVAAGGPYPVAALPLLFPLASGLARSLETLRSVTRRAPSAPLWTLGLALVGWNLAFMQQYASGMIARDFPLPFAQVAGNTAGLVARTVGAPTAWPANWIFALRHGVGPDRFDRAAGKRVPRAPDGAAVVDVGVRDLDDALLLEGWSVRHPCGAEVCRAVDGRARALLPFEGGAAVVRVRAAGRGWLQVGAGTPPRPLGDTAVDLDFAAPPGGAGPRVVTFTVSPGGEALVDRIEVRRP